MKGMRDVSRCPAELRSVFDDWDEDEMPAFEVSIDEDGAQVLHIPCEVFISSHPHLPDHPFPIITRPFPQSPTFEIRISKPDPSIHAASPSEPLPRKPLASPSLEPDTPTPKTKTLVLDTTFLSSLPTTLNLSALSSSWCTPIRSAPNMVLASRWNQREEADVPCSAVAFSPTDGFGEMHFGLIRHQTPSFA
ncbi:hypothetical protein BKA70DRAFT_1466873 [Coprinopsis sp. MPI-PUGE-AT-0042]|nr:hypothetical protein BKA70DRAFT_1466873 [Coprinopsis sp. MPI-PUGE-AT-0042]